MILKSDIDFLKLKYSKGDMKIKEIYDYSVKELQDHEDKYLLSEMVISHAIGKDRIYVKLNMQEDVSDTKKEEISGYIKRLKKNEPIHYILGIRDFFGYDFYLSDKVLIPRSDTEILVQEAIDTIGTDAKEVSGLEIGSGTGIISVSLLKKIKGLTMTAVDISYDALRLTAKNAVSLSVYDRIKVKKSDIYSNLSTRYDFIISNPPYIKSGDIESLDAGVKEYEPRQALDGGKDGLDFYKNIVKDIDGFLKKDGYLFLEIGFDQSEDVTNLILSHKKDAKVKVVKDLANLDRVIVAKF